jgi:hypothetical protein
VPEADCSLAARDHLRCTIPVVWALPATSFRASPPARLRHFPYGAVLAADDGDPGDHGSAGVAENDRPDQPSHAPLPLELGLNIATAERMEQATTSSGLRYFLYCCTWVAEQFSKSNEPTQNSPSREHDGDSNRSRAGEDHRASTACITRDGARRSGCFADRGACSSPRGQPILILARGRSRSGGGGRDRGFKACHSSSNGTFRSGEPSSAPLADPRRQCSDSGHSGAAPRHRRERGSAKPVVDRR